ncbi:P-loop containing nucleoside triphosphate hydrolase protein, partial [Phyllosticta citricarpa]
VALHADDYTKVVSIANQLHTYGIGTDVAPLQVIVCGDRSSGKSSVLEALTGLKFPTGNNICTRFATEVVLRRRTEQSVDVAIVPGPSRTPQERKRLHLFQARNAQFENLPSLLESTRSFIGVGVEGRAFSDDILRIEISNPRNPSLALVDLPGLIDDEDAKDANFVMSINRRFMENPRSIILAVISADNIHADQLVTEVAREIDPQRKRSLGIINKLDVMLDADPEQIRRFLGLAMRKDFTGRIGWHFLSNGGGHAQPRPEGRTTEERCILNHDRWKTLPPGTNGIKALRSRIAAMLTDQIMKDLPTLIHNIRSEITDCEAKLRRLGDSKVTIQEQKLHLIKVSQYFSMLVKSAINGTYTDPADFFNDALTVHGTQKRLRAFVHELLREFADEMRTHGEFEKIVDEPPSLNEKGSIRQISRDHYLEHVRELIKRTNGCGLRGTFNPLVVGDLFRRQSQPWSRIVENSIERILHAVRNFFDLALNHTMDSETGEAVMRRIINPAMETWTAKLQDKVREIMSPHTQGHPITYNLDFADTIQQSRMETFQKLSSTLPSERREAMKSQSLTDRDIELLVGVLRGETGVEVDLYACKEAADCMKAYYEIAMRTVIDNVAVLAVEQCLLRNVPHVFSPETVFKLDDKTVAEIAAESEELCQERVMTEIKLEALKKALQSLTRLPPHRGVDVQSDLSLGDNAVFLRKDTQLEADEEENQAKQETGEGEEGEEEEAKIVCKDESSSTDLPAALTPEAEADSPTEEPQVYDSVDVDDEPRSKPEAQAAMGQLEALNDRPLESKKKGRKSKMLKKGQGLKGFVDEEPNEPLNKLAEEESADQRITSIEDSWNTWGGLGAKRKVKKPAPTNCAANVFGQDDATWT